MKVYITELHNSVDTNDDEPDTLGKIGHIFVDSMLFLISALCKFM